MSAPGLGSGSGGGPHAEARADGVFVVPDAHLLFTADFKRVADDLVLVGHDGERFVIPDYFRTSAHPDLVAPDGARLAAGVVDKLVGPLAPGQWAQAGGAPAAGAAPIGRVEVATGTVTAVRNGVPVTLNVGDTVLKGDVVQTDAASTVAITFIDGTAFNLSQRARMVLDEMVYSDGGSNNQAFLSLVQGSISFIAGQVAKTGTMRVDTPATTLGIRGTAVLVDLTSTDGRARFSVMREQDNRVGSYVLLDKVTGAVLATVNQSDTVYIVTPNGIGQVSIDTVAKTPADQQNESSLVAFLTPLAAIPNLQQNPNDQQPQPPNPQAGPNPQAHNGGSGSSGSSQDGGSGDDGNAGDGHGQALVTSVVGGDPGMPQTTVTVVLGDGGYVAPAPAPIGSGGITILPFSDVQGIGGQLATVSIASQIVASGVESNFQPIVPNSVTISVASQPSSVPAGTNLLSLVTVSDPVNGAVSYDKGQFTFLGQGESVTYAVNFTSVVNGQPTPETLLVTIAGTNDAPVLTATSPTAVAPVTDAPGAVPTASGTLQFTDADNNDQHYLSVVPAQGAKGTLTAVGTANSTSTTAGAAHWTYVADAASYKALAAGQQETETFTIVLLDDKGAQSTQTVQIALTGVNDAPVATASLPAASAVAGQALSLHLPAGSFVDPDAGTVLSYSAAVVGPSGTTPLPDWLTFDPATQTFSGTPSAADAGSLTLRVTASDGSLSASSDFALTVTGSTLSASIAPGQASVVEGQPASFVIALSEAAATPQSVAYSVNGGPAQTVTIAAGQTTATVSLATVDDGQYGTHSPDITVTLSALPGGPPIGTGSATTHVLDAEVAPPATAPVLSVGSFGTLKPTDGSAIATTLHLNAGDTVSVSWNFVAHDYLPYNDFSFAVVNGQTFLLGLTQSVGDYGSTGWKTFTYTASTTGTFSIGLAQFNTIDTALNSHLYVDDVRVNGSVVSSFEGGLGIWTAVAGGTVAVVGTTAESVGNPPVGITVTPTDGASMAFLDSSLASESAIEAFLGLSQGAAATVATPSGTAGSPIALPIVVTTSPSSYQDDVYVTIKGAPSGSTLSKGSFDAATGSWTVEAADLGGLTLTTPTSFSGTFALSVVATAVVIANHTSASTAAQSLTVSVAAPSAAAPVAFALTADATAAGDQPAAESLVAPPDAGGINGDEGPNSLQGTPGSDTLMGLGGNDTLAGGLGSDVLTGGAGADLFVIVPDVATAGRHTVVADFEPGLDLLDVSAYGIADVDTVRALLTQGSSQQVDATVHSGGHEDQLSLVGTGDLSALSFTSANLLLSTTDQDDALVGTALADDLFGGLGNDTLSGGDGGDRLFGEQGNDLLLGQGGNDTLWGGSGDDTLSGGTGSDVLTGGSGSDLFVMTPDGSGRTTEVTDFDPAHDRFDFAAYGISDIATLRSLFSKTAAGALDATIHVNGGEDHIVIAGAEGLSPDSLTDANVVLSTDAAPRSLAGGPGADDLFGGAGSDSLSGGGGSDRLFGGGGNDTLSGGSGSAVLVGGAGDDTFLFNTSTGTSRIADFQGALDTSSGFRDRIVVDHALFASPSAVLQAAGNITVDEGEVAVPAVQITAGSHTLIIEHADVSTLSVVASGQDFVIQGVLVQA